MGYFLAKVADCIRSRIVIIYFSDRSSSFFLSGFSLHVYYGYCIFRSLIKFLDLYLLLVSYFRILSVCTEHIAFYSLMPLFNCWELSYFGFWFLYHHNSFKGLVL